MFALTLNWGFDPDGQPMFGMAFKAADTKPAPAPQKPRKREVKTKPVKGPK